MNFCEKTNRLIIIAYAVFLSVVSCHPSQAEHPAQREQTLTVSTEDGWNIVSTLYHADDEAKPVLVILHGLHSTRSVYPVQTSTLKDFHVLAIDLRGHGDSLLYRGKKTSYKDGIGNVFAGASKDIVASLDAVLLQLPAAKREIVIQGSSFSCLVALNYVLAHPDQVRGIILVSPGDAYGHSYLASMHKLQQTQLQARVAILCSKDDRYCYKHVPALQRMADQSSRMRIFLEPGAVHANALFHKRWQRYPAVLHSFILTGKEQ